jgi:hypothetical protein
MFVWVATPRGTPQGFPDLKDWSVEGVLSDFMEVTRPWLKSADFAIKRVGFGLHSLLSVPDKAAAYRTLEELVPSVRLVEPDAVTDLLIQINRRVPSRVLGDTTQLNRLMKWSSVFFLSAQLGLTPEMAKVAPVVGGYFASLDNDVNTPGERLEPLEKRELGPIYDELVQLAWENLEFGEKV